MADERHAPPDLPTYLLEPLERQEPSRLDDVAACATALGAWKGGEREADADRKREAVDEGTLQRLEDRDVSTDPADFEEVPANGAYVAIKETKPGYRYYYYWQWRAGESWENEYIAPVDPKDDVVDD